MKNFTLGLLVAYLYNRSGASEVVKLTCSKTVKKLNEGLEEKKVQTPYEESQRKFRDKFDPEGN